MDNPFSVKTPETLKAKDIATLFVDVFSDFPRLLESEHTFLHGARGTGKSMMLRYLEPHVQLAAEKVRKANELAHYAIHMPIKKANYALSELERLNGAPYWLLSEHIITVNAVIHILDSLRSLYNPEESEAINEDLDKFCLEFIKLTKESGCNSEIGQESSQIGIESLRKIFEQEHRNALYYLRKLTFGTESFPYEGALFGYVDFFVPFVRLVVELKITPSGPIFLMLDDADNLPERMQKVVNSWVSYRTTDQICLKVSTQQRYKTWRTIQGTLIESPHDYSEIDINTVYTSKQSSHYYERVEEIVKRRLDIGRFSNTSPSDFFPSNPKQESELAVIKEKIKSEWKEGKKVSSRISDDVTRYAVSEYMKQLAKVRKTNTYSYSGFRSMVDISSGIIRFFLEPAARMYSEVIAGNHHDRKVDRIPHQVQDRVLSDWSKEFMLVHFEKLRRTEESAIESLKDTSSKVDQLKNLIISFGDCFQEKLLSDDTERRFLSFMPTQEVTKELQDILDLAIEWGYLYRSSIARKEGIGRNPLYVLNRRLAPYFKLDPSGYAAYMSVTPDLLTLATDDPIRFVRERLGGTTNKSVESDKQSSLFNNEKGSEL